MNDQQVIQALAKIRDERLPLCECGGSGEASSDENKFVPMEGTCPKCLDMRGLELCWHEKWHYVDMVENNGSMWKCEQCGWEVLSYQDPNTIKYESPDLTTHPHGSKLWITHALQVLGVWDEFVEWNKKTLKWSYTQLYNKPGVYSWFFIHHHDELIADILTDGKLLIEAISSFLTQRVVK